MRKLALLLFACFSLSPVAQAENTYNKVNPEHIAALITLYNSTGGTNWTRNDNWLTYDPEINNPVCTWQGVNCHNELYSDDGNGNKTFDVLIWGLSLHMNNLAGTLPAALGQLADLRHVQLNNNKLSGSITAALGSLTELTRLTLEHNQFSGTIPSSLGNLSLLQTLVMHGNQLTGTIPDSLGNLSKLTYFGAAGNQLSGSIPTSIGSMSSLQSLVLGGNQLSGSIPSSIGNLSSLKELLLSPNQLTGAIPPSIGSLSNVEQVSLSHNQLSGPIPASIGQLSKVQYMYLEYNELTGQVPEEIGGLGSIRLLWLSHNQLDGILPDSFGNLSQLEHLRLSSNQISGEIPPSMGQLTAMRQFDLTNNQLSGALPSEYLQLLNDTTSSLGNFQVSNNPQLGGNITSKLVEDFPQLVTKLKNEDGGVYMWLHPLLGNQSCFIDNAITSKALQGTNWYYGRCADEAFSCPEENTGPFCLAGNPMNMRKGIKLQSETDFQSIGPYPLSVKRNYSSADRKWKFSSVDASLWNESANNHMGVSLSNGRSYMFSGSGPTFSSYKVANETTAYEGYKLAQIDDGYRFTKPRGSSLDFDFDGQLIRKNNAKGFSQYISKTANSVTVSDDFGSSYTLMFDQYQRPISLATTQGNYQYQYDEQGHLTSIIYPDNSVRQYHYDEQNYSESSAKGLLTGMTDANGDRYASWYYDKAARVWQSKHGTNAEVTSIVYNDGGTQPIRDESLPSGSRKRHYLDAAFGLRVEKTEHYDASDFLIGTETFLYGGFGHVKEKVDLKGTITRYTRDTQGREFSRTEAADTSMSRVISTEYNGSLSLPSKVTTPEMVIEYSYDASQKPTSVKRTDTNTGTSRTTTYQYDANGLMTSIDGPRTDVNDITTFEYDAKGRRVKAINALGHTSEIISMDLAGRPLEVKDSNGGITTLLYNVRGKLVSSTTNGQTTTMTYDAVGQQKSVALPNGQSISYEYDSAHQMIAMQDTLGNRMEYTLDGAGNRIKTDIKDSQGALKQTRQQIFDNFSRLKSIVSSHGDTQSYDYNAVGELTLQTDSLDYKTGQGFDALGNKVSTLDPMGGVTSFRYDNAGRNTSVTDAEGKTTVYQYNGFGEVVEQNSPDSGITKYSYDGAGNMVQMIHGATSRTTNYQFDALNRLRSDSAMGLAYSYDETTAGNLGVGRLTSVTDNSGSQQLIYNAFGSVISDTRVIGGITLITLYHYDDANRMIGTTYPSGRKIEFSFNTLGKVSGISTTKNGQTHTLASTVQYLPFGPLTNVTYGNGLQLTRSYDLDYRQTNQSLTGIENTDITFTLRDNVATITNSIDSTNDQTFSYSPLQRLIDATGEHGQLNFSYDKVGNRQSKTDDGQVDNYSYVVAKHQLQNITGAQSSNFSYNGAGETIQKNAMTFNYNIAGRMVSATNQGITTSYQYNHLNQRVSKSDSEKSTYYVYDLNGNLTSEVSQNGSADIEYVYLDSQILSVIHNPVLFVPPPEDKVLDDLDTSVTKVGQWSQSKSRKALAGYHQTANGNTGASLNWAPSIYGGSYEVYTRWIANRKYAKQATYTISHNGKTSLVSADQTSNGQQWNLLGTFDFNGQGGESVTLDDSNGKVSADGLRMVRVVDLPPQNSQTKMYYAHNNHIGTPTRLTDATARLVWQAFYTPFGLANINQDADGDGMDVIFNPRFSGQYHDGETGLNYNWHRYYDPQTGRYISSDPIGLAGGVNTYAYVENSPVNFIDPFGLAKKDPDSQYCKSIERKINNLSKELDKRWNDLAADKHSLPERIGPGEALHETIRGHRTKINETDSRLKKNLKDYDDDCGGGGPLIPVGDNAEEGGECPLGEGNCQKATQVVVVGTTAYVIYRCFRLAPSLFPPLWPTIPANLAVP